MGDKLEALSQPIGYVGKNCINSVASGNLGYIKPNDAFGESPVYSQGYVTALLAELEETRSTLKSVTECWNDEYQRNQFLKRAEALQHQAVKDGNRIAELEREKDTWEAASLAMRDCWREEKAELEQRLQQPIKLPPLDDDLSDLLGRPNFMCAGMAQALRVQGFDIPNRSENEQAAVLHFLLSHYLADSKEWRRTAATVLRGDADKVEGE